MIPEQQMTQGQLQRARQTARWLGARLVGAREVSDEETVAAQASDFVAQARQVLRSGVGQVLGTLPPAVAELAEQLLTDEERNKIRTR
jgi:phosphohistidine phosphatase SixA